MANAVYPKFKENLMKGLLGDLTSKTIKVAFLSGGYTYNSAHELYSDLGANVVANSAPLTNITVTNGVFDADNASFTGVSGAQVVAFALWIDDTTDRLIYYCDTGQTGLPFLPNGGNVTLTWDNGAYKIFLL